MTYVIYDINIFSRATYAHHCLILPWQQRVANAEMRISRLIAKEHPPRVIDIRELVDSAKDFVPFPIISFNCKKVPVTKLARRVRSTYKVAKDIGARLTSQ